MQPCRTARLALVRNLLAMHFYIYEADLHCRCILSHFIEHDKYGGAPSQEELGIIWTSSHDQMHVWSL